MSIRKETKTRNYYAWVLYDTKSQAAHSSEARDAKKEGRPFKIAKHRMGGYSGWVVWRWNEKRKK